MQPHDIGDQNVERLVGASYKPESPDLAFVQRLQTRLQAAARSMAPLTSEAQRLLKLRRRLGWSMAAAAAVAGVALLLHALDRPGPGTKVVDQGNAKLPPA